MKLRKLFAAALSLAIFCTAAPTLIDYSTKNYLTAGAADERFIGIWDLTYVTYPDDQNLYPVEEIENIFNLKKDGTASSVLCWSDGAERIDKLLWTSDDNNIYITYTDDERHPYADLTFSDFELLYDFYDEEDDSLSTFHYLKTSLGDTNLDESIDAKDASLILVEYATLSTGGDSTFTLNKRVVSDINNDNNIDAKDATMVLSYYTYISTGGNKSIYQFIR